MRKTHPLRAMAGGLALAMIAPLAVVAAAQPAAAQVAAQPAAAQPAAAQAAAQPVVAGTAAAVAPAAGRPAARYHSGCQPATNGLTLPRWSDHGILQAQVFDRQVPDPTVYAGRVGFVWASTQAVQPTDAVTSSYMTAFRNAPARSFTPEWFQQNHPSWIEYTADGGEPAWEFNNHIYTPLDIGNPEVRQWYAQNLIDPAIAAGYKVIAIDNIVMRNDFHMGGHYDAAGAWVQQFGSDPKDPAYTGYVLDWLRYLRDYAHARGVAVAFNVTFNASLHDEYQDTSQALITAIGQAIDISDIWLNEQGFTMHRVENVNDNEWQLMFDLLREHKCKPAAILNKLPTDTWDQAAPEQRRWVVANYLLYREEPTMLESTGKTDYAAFNEIPELAVDLGRPTAGPLPRGATLWSRTYELGMTVVNPSSTVSAALTLPAGIWTDLLGGQYSGRIVVPPNTGLVLSRP